MRPAFPFWGLLHDQCFRRESNPQHPDSKSGASTNWTTEAERAHLEGLLFKRTSLGLLPGHSPMCSFYKKRPTDAPASVGRSTTLPQGGRPVNMIQEIILKDLQESHPWGCACPGRGQLPPYGRLPHTTVSRSSYLSQPLDGGSGQVRC